MNVDSFEDGDFGTGERFLMGTRETAAKGRGHVEGELKDRGFLVHEVRDGRRVYLSATMGGRSFKIYVRTKTTGDWQIRALEVRPAPAAPTTFTVLVDIGRKGPRYWVVPQATLETIDYERHRDYLARHGGIRPNSPGSTHSATKEVEVTE